MDLQKNKVYRCQITVLHSGRYGVCEDRRPGGICAAYGSWRSVRCPHCQGDEKCGVRQSRDIFPQMTVQENLELALYAQKKHGKVPDYIYDLFPILPKFAARRGGDLSGGQQQQLAIARALVADPKVLILDEPTEGIQAVRHRGHRHGDSARQQGTGTDCATGRAVSGFRARKHHAAACDGKGCADYSSTTAEARALTFSA